jgi:GNAT superfamily N-acetyltransferase
MLETVTLENSCHPLIPVVRELFREYMAELAVDLCFQGFEAELAELPGKYCPPSGVLVVVLDGDQPVACGALRPLESNVCELKRIYVRPSHRGSGLGRSITLDLMKRAKQIGYTVVRLDTLRRLTPALGLYTSLGFAEIHPYNFNPEPDVAYFERPL